MPRVSAVAQAIIDSLKKYPYKWEYTYGRMKLIYGSDHLVPLWVYEGPFFLKLLYGPILFTLWEKILIWRAYKKWKRDYGADQTHRVLTEIQCNIIDHLTK